MTWIGIESAILVSGHMLGRFSILIPVATLAVASGATLERLSFDDLVRKSTHIVRGRIQGRAAAFQGSVIYTHYNVQVSERWKGGQDTIDVVVPGGLSGGLRQSFAGAPDLIDGQEYVLFLWTSKSGLTHIIGLSQGKFDLAKDANGVVLASRGEAKEAMIDPVTKKMVPDASLIMPVDRLRGLVHSKLAGN